MKVFSRYLIYRLENSTLRTVIFTILSVAITQMVVSESTGRMYAENNETGIYILAIILGLFCTLIPILETAAFKNRRNLDTLYFFPIKREKMALVHFLSGYIQIAIIYSVSFFSAYWYLAAQTNYFRLEYMMLYYLLSLLVGLVMYSVFMFLFGQGNTVADGVIFCVLWMFVIYLIAYVVRTEILRPYLQEHNMLENSVGIAEWGIIYAPINNLTVIFQDVIEVNREAHAYDYTNVYAQRYLSQAYMFFIWGVVGVAAAIGYFVTFVKKGAQKAGEISDSWFGYKLLIPAYGYTLILYNGSTDIGLVLIIAMMVIGYIIYRRGFKFKVSDLIAMGCAVLPLILNIIF